MLTIRRAEERGHVDHGWLDTYHTFSFASYYDPDFMRFRALRVINEDRVSPGEGFPTHPHENMEIITYIVEGALKHEDSMGNGSVIRPGDVQRMSAGTGILHSEYNPSDTDPVHLLQIWIMPEEKGLKPSYEQRAFSREEKLRKLRLIASRGGRNGSVTIHQDASVYATILEPSDTITVPLAEDRHAWLQVVSGDLNVGTHSLHAGDGVAVSDETSIELKGISESEILVFDLA